MGVARPIKIIDQLSNIDAALTNENLVITGSMISLDGLSGTISYQNNISELIDYLNQWALTLIFLNNDNRFYQWVNLSTGIVNLNEYNYYYTQLTTNQQNVQINELMAYYFTITNGLKRQYSEKFSTLYNIYTTGMDSDKILNMVDGTLIIFGVMLNNINTFYNSVILNSSLITTNELAVQINTLKKYNTYNVKPIAFNV